LHLQEFFVKFDCVFASVHPINVIPYLNKLY
jgi:hypothetical protein